jgi:hypothetical protein
MSGVVAALDDIPKPVWIAGMVVGFICFWPVGLAILVYLIWSRRMGHWRHAYGGCWGAWHHPAGGWGTWHYPEGERNGGAERNARRCGRAPSSGNRAFDEYRAETLRRLEDEQRDFVAFLDRLRMAKDKAEFDQFMAERQQRPPSPEPHA